MTRAELVAEARRLREEGMTQRAIARTLGVSQGSVSLWLSGAGYSPYRCSRCNNPLQVEADLCGFCIEEALVRA